MENTAIREAGMAAGLKGVELRRAEVYTKLGYVLDDALKLSARYCPSSHLYKLENGQFLNTAELAEHSGISKGKVRKLITAGVSATDIYNNNFQNERGVRIKAGDAISFPAGEGGAHVVKNTSDKNVFNEPEKR